MKFALQIDKSTTYGQQVWRGLLQQLRDKVRAVKEAASAASQAPLTRKSVQARLAGAPDASRTVGRITEPKMVQVTDRRTAEHDEDVPLDALKSDLRRKVALRSVMGKPKGETEETGDTRRHDLRSDDWLGSDDCSDEDKDAQGRCPDDPEFDLETAGQYVGQYEASERLAEVALRTFAESYGLGMAQASGPPSEAPESLSGQDLGKYLANEGTKLPPDDPKVDLRYSGSNPPVPGARCGSCVFFRPDFGACRIVSNAVTPALVCSLWTPAKGEGDAVSTFAHEMKS